MRSFFPLAALAVSVGCAGTSHSGHGHGPDRTPPPEETTDEPSAPRADGRPFAETPLTEIANELTEIALAVIADRPPPATQAPSRTRLAGPAEVRWHTEAPTDTPVVIGIAFEVEVILKRGEPEEEALPPARWGSIRFTLALSRNGLRLYSLHPRTMSRALPGGSLPRGMEGMAAVGAELLAAIRGGDVSAYSLDESDRALLANDEVWLQVQQDRVSPELVTQVRAMLETLPDAPLAYRLDDVAVLAADGDRLISLAFEWDAEGESFVLATEPLLEVRQLWPR